MADFEVRQGDRLPAVRAIAYTEAGFVDLTAFTGGIVFRMVRGTTVITGTATGDVNGNLTYQWAAGDTAVAGTYSAVFVATDGAGKIETFPTGRNLEGVVVPSI